MWHPPSQLLICWILSKLELMCSCETINPTEWSVSGFERCGCLFQGFQSNSEGMNKRYVFSVCSLSSPKVNKWADRFQGQIFYFVYFKPCRSHSTFDTLNSFIYLHCNSSLLQFVMWLPANFPLISNNAETMCVCLSKSNPCWRSGTDPSMCKGYMCHICCNPRRITSPAGCGCKTWWNLSVNESLLYNRHSEGNSPRTSGLSLSVI